MPTFRRSRLFPVLLLSSLFLGLYAPSVSAAEIYGQVWIAGSKAHAVGAVVSVGPEVHATVDKKGNYRIKDAKDGWLVMTIKTEDGRGSKPLKIKAEGFTRVDIELTRISSTQDWILRRR